MLKLLGSVVPGPALLFVTEWLNLYSHTALAYPNWQRSAEDISLAIGVVIAIVLGVILKDALPDQLKRNAKRFAVLMGVGIIACLAFWFLLGRGFSTNAALLLQDLWFLVFIATMAFMVASVTAAALALRETKPNLFWWIVIVFVVIVLGIVAYLIWKAV